MQVAEGISILNKIGIGRIRFYRTPEYRISEDPAADTASELERFENARERVRRQQLDLYEKAAAQAGEEIASIFRFHADILDDEGLLKAVRRIMEEEKHTADYAASHGFDNAARKFRAMEDPYFRARGADITDVGNAVTEAILGIEHGSVEGTEPYILAAEDLTPSETVRLDRSRLLGIITREGSTASHTAILARSMDLPALVQCRDLSEDWDGKTAILDGESGRVYIDPSPELLASFTARQEEEKRRKALLQKLKGKASTTADGTSIRVFANISGPEDIDSVRDNDAEGVGLFRSEFVYLGSSEDPSEEQQFAAYRQVVEALAPLPVVIRTCDLGADKTAAYLGMQKEANPAMGLRAIRYCLSKKDFFRKQLRAILRASAYGDLGIMFPMITSLEEVHECRELLEECRKELEKEGKKVADSIRVGIMVETPAAVLIADELAGEADFFSLGTNDLIQYICAADRQNAQMERYADPYHPAVLKAIRMSVEAGHRHHIPVGICGELAADLTLTEEFLRMGVDELSVNAQSVLPLREKIRSIDLKSGAQI